jgi:hypothetical protein
MRPFAFAFTQFRTCGPFLRAKWPVPEMCDVAQACTLSVSLEIVAACADSLTMETAETR